MKIRLFSFKFRFGKGVTLHLKLHVIKSSIVRREWRMSEWVRGWKGRERGMLCVRERNRLNLEPDVMMMMGIWNCDCVTAPSFLLTVKKKERERETVTNKRREKRNGFNCHVISAIASLVNGSSLLKGFLLESNNNYNISSIPKPAFFTALYFVLSLVYFSNSLCLV